MRVIRIRWMWDDAKEPGPAAVDGIGLLRSLDIV